MSIAALRHWLGTDAPSPHDTELKRAVRDALIEHDALLAELRKDVDEPCSQCGLVDECCCYDVQSSDDTDAEGEAP